MHNAQEVHGILLRGPCVSMADQARGKKFADAVAALGLAERVDDVFFDLDGHTQISLNFDRHADFSHDLKQIVCAACEFFNGMKYGSINFDFWEPNP